MDYRAPFELVDRLLTKKYSFKRISFEETWIVMPAAGWEDGKIIPLKPEEKTVPLRTEEEVNTDPEHVACYWLDDPEVFKKYTDMTLRQYRERYGREQIQERRKAELISNE